MGTLYNNNIHMKTCKQTLDVAALSKSVSKLPLSSVLSPESPPQTSGTCSICIYWDQTMLLFAFHN